ncbi:MAG TPA: hypothetical protein VK539_33605 [Myxococcaceae bacterium]|nr:hypothetical protein [Myxococcaceae bacterium]
MSLGLYRTHEPAIDMMLNLRFPPMPLEFYIGLRVQPLSVFSEVAACGEFVDMVRVLASHYPVTHVQAGSSAESVLADSPYFGRDKEMAYRDGFDKLYELSWLNVFSPQLVETLGRERLLSTPAHRVEALPHGAVLFVTWPTAADFASDEARQAQARAFVHLRPDLDFETVLRTLRERSQTLAPVEPRFHPDVAALLSRVVDSVTFSQRQREVAQLNSYQPPVPDEWLPVQSALPVDVPDVPQALHALAYQAEHLVALLHTKVPSVFEGTPESLTDVDFRFWHQNFPEIFERQRIDEIAVPAIGAYLGQVLVRHLGGQWLPRRNWQEAQVKVGTRVWLPFVRAHRYMRSRQALLDYSLTQLFREAQRHRG